MKHSPLSVLLLFIVILLTFSSEKVFSMDYFYKKKEASPQEKAQARFQESRAEAGSQNGSSAISRGVLGSGTGPSEKQGLAQDDWENNATIGEASDEEQDESQDSYSYSRELTDQQQAYLYLQQIQDKRDEAETAFAQAGQLNKGRNIYSMALDFTQKSINDLAVTLQQAEQRLPAEQASAFEAALEDAENKKSYVSEHLNTMIEDVRYMASHSHVGESLSILRTLGAWSQAHGNI